MFNKIGRKKKSFWSPTTIIVSLLLHVLLGVAAYAGGLGEDRAKQKKEELVDFMELEEEKQEEQKEEPKPEEPPPPPPPAPEEAPPPVVKGFQELVPPEEPPAKIPDVDPTQQAASVEDFSGVGQAGGVAKGVEGGVAQDVSERDEPVDVGTYELAAVEERPELTNRNAVRSAVERNYPPLLRDAGVSGQVTLRFRVNADGTVDASSISVENSTHDAFGDAARRVIERARFRPAKVGGRAVPVWVQLPVNFQLTS